MDLELMMKKAIIIPEQKGIISVMPANLLHITMTVDQMAYAMKMKMDMKRTVDIRMKINMDMEIEMESEMKMNMQVNMKMHMQMKMNMETKRNIHMKIKMEMKMTM